MILIRMQIFSVQNIMYLLEADSLMSFSTTEHCGNNLSYVFVLSCSESRTDRPVQTVRHRRGNHGGDSEGVVSPEARDNTDCFQSPLLSPVFPVFSVSPCVPGVPGVPSFPQCSQSVPERLNMQHFTH